MASTTNEEVCNYHFLNFVNGVHGTTCDISSTPAATSQDVIMNSTPNLGQKINELGAQIQQQPSIEACKSTDHREQNDKLMKMLIRKDSTIERMSFELQKMEERLQLAVNGKLDAISQLEKTEGKEQTLSFKEREMESEVKRLNDNIKCLTENLNTNVTELTNVRGELLSASAQFDIDIKSKSEELRIVHSYIAKLNETNDKLKKQNKDHVEKMQDQLEESRKLLQICDENLNSQTKLTELYKGNSDDYEAQVEQLSGGIAELQKYLREAVDQCGIFETQLKESELERQDESKAKNDVIIKLKQELKDANSLLKAYRSNDSDGFENEDEIGMETVNNLSTFTELYSQYRSVVEQLHTKEEEYNSLELRMKICYEDIKEKAVEFEEQRVELNKHREANEKLIEERNNLRAGTVIGREELKSLNLRCELLKSENDKLKFFGYDYLKKFLIDDRSDSKFDFSIAGNKSNAAELEQQNQKLLAIVSHLSTRLHRIEANEDCDLVDESDETSTTTNAHVTSTTSTCNKSVEVTEYDLMIEGDTSNSRNVANVTTPNEDLLKIEELTRDNSELRNKIRELSAEKNLLLAERNLFDVRYKQCNEQIVNLEKQNDKHIDTISEHTITNRYLRDKNANIATKLFVTENDLEHLQNQHRSLTDVKDSFVVEVEALKQELLHEKVSNKTLAYELALMKSASERMKTELKMRIENADCSVAFERMNEVERCPDISRKFLTDEAIQTDDVVETNEQSRSEANETVDNEFSQSEKSTFLNSLHLTESTKSQSADLSPTERSTTSEVKRKRVEQNDEIGDSALPTGRKMRLRTNKKARVSFVDLSEDSDEECVVDVCNVDNCPDLQNIQLQCLSEVRTRKQARFVHDAFNSSGPSSNLYAKLSTSTDERVSNRKRRRSGSRGRSSRRRSSGVGRTGSVTSPSRNQSVEHHQSTTVSRSTKSRSSSGGRSSSIVVSSSRSRSVDHPTPAAEQNESAVDRMESFDVPRDTGNHMRINSSYSRRSRRLISRYRRLTEIQID